MNKAIISVSVVLRQFCSSVIWPAAAQRGEKAQRFFFERTDSNGDGFVSENEFPTSQLERFKKWMRTETEKFGLRRTSKRLKNA